MRVAIDIPTLVYCVDSAVARRLALLVSIRLRLVDSYSRPLSLRLGRVKFRLAAFYLRCLVFHPNINCPIVRSCRMYTTLPILLELFQTLTFFIQTLTSFIQTLTSFILSQLTIRLRRYSPATPSPHLTPS